LTKYSFSYFDKSIQSKSNIAGTTYEVTTMSQDFSLQQNFEPGSYYGVSLWMDTAEIAHLEKIGKNASAGAGPGESILIVKRPNLGIIGSATDHNIYIDGKYCAGLRPGQQTEIVLPNGTYVKNACFVGRRPRNCKGTEKNNRFLEVP
jgi:hypothetical protein